MKEWRKINMRLGQRASQTTSQDEKEKLQSQMISRKQAKSRFKLEAKIPSYLLMRLFERVGLISV